MKSGLIEIELPVGGGRPRLPSKIGREGEIFREIGDAQTKILVHGNPVSPPPKPLDLCDRTRFKRHSPRLKGLDRHHQTYRKDNINDEDFRYDSQHLTPCIALPLPHDPVALDL